jgi:polysaccharide pyruvyl transferase WcaK-like protein
MRILVATGLNRGTAEYKNLGDVAMLQAAVSRLQHLWPEARVEVITDSAAELARFCPAAKPLPRAAGRYWIQERTLRGPFQRFLPRWASAGFDAAKQSLRSHWPGLLELLVRLRLRLGNHDRRKEFELFLDGWNHADLLVVCGAGGFADSCREWNLSILGTMEAARQSGVPVAMFGQGMGPLNDPLVLSRASKVLPRVNLITLRGGDGGLQLLKSLGVNAATIATTGDEAVEIAYEARSQERGDAIGINLRVAAYAGVEAITIQSISSLLQNFARRHAARLLPVPIAVHEFANDHLTIRQLLAGWNAEDESEGGLALDTPLKVVQQIGRCGMVVTGAYHAAVFALAQGVPAVCLASSEYYLAKFKGLRGLFGAGCDIVRLDEADFPAKLTEAMERMWNSADTVRESLRQAAAQQIEARRRAYQQMLDMVTAQAAAAPESSPKLSRISLDTTAAG